MKKLLMLILIGLLLALSIYIGLNGFEVGGIEVLSYADMKTKNGQLDTKIQEASKLAEKDYRQVLTTVQESSKRLKEAKEDYEEMTEISSEEDIQLAGQIERYEIEALWVKLGNYATTEGAVIKMDIVQGNANDSYNLKFTVNGSYISITDFISDIENDSTLGFQIEEFKMIPTASGENLQATFICKDIFIKEMSEINETEETEDTDNSNTTNTNTNTTNSSKSNTTNTNSTNSTNKSNAIKNEVNVTGNLLNNMTIH